jgi:hypothetical protein
MTDAELASLQGEFESLRDSVARARGASAERSAIKIAVGSALRPDQRARQMAYPMHRVATERP